jgi:hypothetical protein
MSISKVTINPYHKGDSSSDSDDELGKKVSRVNAVALKELEKAVAFHASAAKNPNGISPYGTPMETPDRANSSGGATSADGYTSGGDPGIEFPHVE